MARSLVSVAAAVIAVLTLWPMRGAPGQMTSVWCIGCRELDGLDFIRNVLLFMPLGVGLALARCRISRATAAGALLSLTVEALQFVIPGRTPLVGDLLANSMGTFLGAVLVRHRDQWLEPSRLQARVLTAAFGAAFVGVLLGTAFLLKPAVPSEPLFGQWAPRQRAFSRFQGRLDAVQVAGVSLPYGRVIDIDPYRHGLASRSLVIAADVVTGPARPDRVAAIARMVNPQTEMFFIGQRGRDLIFRLRLRAADAGLRTLTIAAPDAFPVQPERVRLESGIDGETVFARVIRPSDSVMRRLTLDPSLGWAFLLPVEVPLGDWTGAVSHAWLALLAWPIGFYAAAAVDRRRRPAFPARRNPDVWMLLAPASIIVGLGIVPYLTYTASASWSHWVSAFIGVLIGQICWHGRICLRNEDMGTALCLSGVH